MYKKYSDKFVVDCSLISLCGKNSNEISEQSLGILEGKIDPGTSVGLSATDRSIFQRWIVKKVKDNTYEIYDEYNLALTYDKKKKTLSIEQYTGDKTSSGLYIRQNRKWLRIIYFRIWIGFVEPTYLAQKQSCIDVCQCSSANLRISYNLFIIFLQHNLLP